MHTIDPKLVSVVIGVLPMTGFTDGTFIEVERDEDAFVKRVGADGEVTRVKTNNKAGQITVTLDQASNANDYLSGLALADELLNAGVVPVLIRDTLGNTLVAGTAGWVKRLATGSYGKKAEDRKWVIDCGSLAIFIGGSTN